MVADFFEVTAIANEAVVEVWDHAFLPWKNDRPVLEFLATLPRHRTVEFEQPPTAEHLAVTAFGLLEAALAAYYGSRLALARVRLFKTPNARVDACPRDR